MVKRKTTPKVEIPFIVLPLVLDGPAAKGGHELALRLRSPGDAQRLTMLLQREMEGIPAMYLAGTHLGVTQYSMRPAGARRTVMEAGYGVDARAAEPTWAVFTIIFNAEIPEDLVVGGTVQISSVPAAA